MTMEKNGAINSETPPCCGGGGCTDKMAGEVELRQLPSFPENDADADNMDQDLTKQATDAVADASKSCDK